MPAQVSLRMFQRKSVLLTIYICVALFVPNVLCNGLAKSRLYSDEERPGAMVLVLLTAEKVPKYLNYTDSNLTPVVRVKVAYREIDKNRDNTQVHYEDLWYANGNPAGMVRHYHFDPQHCQIILRVNQQQVDECELEPLANALVRLYLDATLNDDVMYSCVVPNDSFDGIVTAFRSQKFFAAGMPLDIPVTLDPSITLPLHTVSSGRNLILEFAI